MASKLPLKCDICPKKPRFSDVSHLLTHISSKTHLSNIFKAKVRADSDTETRRLVEDYDQWYAEWNIHDLLAERLNQKDTKVTRPRRAAAKASTPRTSGTRTKRRDSMASRATATNEPNTKASSRAPSQQVDPNLAMFNSRPQAMPSRLSEFYNSSHPFPNLPPPSQGFGYNNLHPHRPDLAQYSYPTAYDARRPTYGLPFTYPNPQLFAQSTGQGSIASMAPPRRAAFTMANSKIRRVATPDEFDDPFVKEEDDDSDDDLDDDLDDDEIAVTEADLDRERAFPGGENCPRVHPKGIIWPGMDCFDAADIKQRSQRNQKKSESAYRALIINSERNAVILETVYKLPASGDWRIEKCKEITGIPSPSSLAPSSPVVPRRTSPRKHASSALHQSYVDPKAILNSGDGRFDRDLELTVLSVGKRHLSVFNDDDDRDSQSTATFAHKRQSKARPKQSRLHLDHENEQAAAIKAATSTKENSEGPSQNGRHGLPSFDHVPLGINHNHGTGEATRPFHLANSHRHIGSLHHARNGAMPSFANVNDAGLHPTFGPPLSTLNIQPMASPAKSTDRLNDLATIASQNLHQSPFGPLPHYNYQLPHQNGFNASPSRASTYGMYNGVGQADFTPLFSGTQFGAHHQHGSSLSWATNQTFNPLAPRTHGYSDPDRFAITDVKPHSPTHAPPPDMYANTLPNIQPSYDMFSWNFERPSGLGTHFMNGQDNYGIGSAAAHHINGANTFPSLAAIDEVGQVSPGLMGATTPIPQVSLRSPPALIPSIEQPQAMSTASGLARSHTVGDGQSTVERMHLPTGDTTDEDITITAPSSPSPKT